MVLCNKPIPCSFLPPSTPLLELLLLQSYSLLIIIIDSLRLIFLPFSSVTASRMILCISSIPIYDTHTHFLFCSLAAAKVLDDEASSSWLHNLRDTWPPPISRPMPYPFTLGMYRAWLHFTPYSNASISNHTSPSIECSSCREISYVGVQILHSCRIHHNNIPFNFETRLCPFPFTNCEALELVHSRSKECCHKMTVCERALHADGLGTETAHIQHHIFDTMD